MTCKKHPCESCIREQIQEKEKELEELRKQLPNNSIQITQYPYYTDPVTWNVNLSNSHMLV